MTGRERIFYNTMNTLSTDGIVDAMVRTWDEPEGAIFREIGFEIIEARHGEEYADRVYNNLWDELHG